MDGSGMRSGIDGWVRDVSNSLQRKTNRSGMDGWVRYVRYILQREKFAEVLIWYGNRTTLWISPWSNQNLQRLTVSLVIGWWVRDASNSFMRNTVCWGTLLIKEQHQVFQRGPQDVSSSYRRKKLGLGLMDGSGMWAIVCRGKSLLRYTFNDRTTPWILTSSNQSL